MRVPADPRRRELTPAEALAALRRASAHGGRGPLLDYVFDVGGMRGIVLDTIRRSGGAAASCARRNCAGWRGS